MRGEGFTLDLLTRIHFLAFEEPNEQGDQNDTERDDPDGDGNPIIGGWLAGRR